MVGLLCFRKLKKCSTSCPPFCSWEIYSLVNQTRETCWRSVMTKFLRKVAHQILQLKCMPRIFYTSSLFLFQAATLVGVPCATLAGLIITESKTVRGKQYSTGARRLPSRILVVLFNSLPMSIHSLIIFRYFFYTFLSLCPSSSAQL